MSNKEMWYLVEIVIKILYYVFAAVGWGFAPVAVLWLYKRLFAREIPWEYLSPAVVKTVLFWVIITGIVLSTSLLQVVLPYSAFYGLLVMDGWFLKDAYIGAKSKKWITFVYNGLPGLFLFVLIIFIGYVVVINI